MGARWADRRDRQIDRETDRRADGRTDSLRQKSQDVKLLSSFGNFRKAFIVITFEEIKF